MIDQLRFIDRANLGVVIGRHPGSALVWWVKLTSRGDGIEISCEANGPDLETTLTRALDRLQDSGFRLPALPVPAIDDEVPF